MKKIKKIISLLLPNIILLLVEKYNLRKRNVDNRNLSGDRFVEWSWVAKHLPVGKKVLDIGCCYSIVSPLALRNNNKVVGVDLNDETEFEMKNFTFIKGDFNKIKLKEIYDTIVLASTVEHIGLGGRYNSTESIDGDLITMRKVKKFLSKDSTVILTIPVGVDGVYMPYHRVYGKERLNKLLDGYKCISEEYWIKKESKWIEVDKDTALDEIPSANYYGIGCFLLKKTDEKE